MEPSDNMRPAGTATSASAEQLAPHVQTFESTLARYGHLLAEAQETASEWKRIFDAVEDPICVVTADYQLVHANTAYVRLFGTGYERGGMHYCFITHADDGGPVSPCVDCPLPDTVRTRSAGFTEQEWRVPVATSDSPQSRLYQRWTYPVVNADGAVDRVVEVLKDVTEQERMRRAVTKAEAVREADRLKAELLGTVSHELRSPLSAIKGYAATLLRHERRLPREERHAFLEAIGEASDRLETIINRLLEMSQLETGSITPHCSPVDAAQVAREAITLVEQRAQASMQGKYVFNLRSLGGNGVAGRTLPLIEADPRLLRDVLDNLLENAVKYSPAGGTIDVTLGVRHGSDAPGAAETAPVSHTMDAEPQDMLEIVVRDTGLGIPAEHLGRVFERFHRVDTRLTREVDGLGLGLAMCQRIAEMHGGSMWAESVSGAGSAFHLVLPMDAMHARHQLAVPSS